MNTSLIRGEASEFGPPRDGRLFVRNFLFFAGTVLSLFYLTTPPLLLQPVLRGLSGGVGAAVNLVGVSALVEGNRVVLPGVFGIEIAGQCSGIPELLLFASAIMAFDTTTRAKAVGVLLGSIAIFLGNLIRLSVLFWIGVRSPEYFDLVHDYLAGLVSYTAMALLWWGWLRLAIPRRPEAVGPGFGSVHPTIAWQH